MNPNVMVSVIIPARNEEDNIGRAVRSVAAQENVREILVVDDQSTDGTDTILEGLKLGIPALRVVHIDSLPEGCVGKTHALAVGAREATGEWLLFTDADVEHLPGSLRELLERAQREDIDLLSLSPGQLTPTWWEKAVIPLVYVWLSQRFRFEEVNDPASQAAAANGQYILIRRQAYDRAGGYQAVQDAVLDDVALAQRMKVAGSRLLFLPGACWARTRMYRTFRSMWQGWTKNLHLLAGGSLKPIAGTVAELWLLDLLPFAAPVFGLASATGFVKWPWAALLLMAGCAVLLWRGARYAKAIRELGFRPLLSLYRIPGAFIFSLLLLNSAWAYRVRRRVEWKGRTYPMKEPPKASSETWPGNMEAETSRQAPKRTIT